MIGHRGAIAQVYLLAAAGLLALAYREMQRARAGELARRRGMTDEVLELTGRVERLEADLEAERSKPRRFEGPPEGPVREVKVERPEP